MRHLLLVMALAIAGCAPFTTITERIATNYMEGAATEVNQVAFQGKVQYTLCWCDRNKNPDCWNHHGLYEPARRRIHIAPEWYWEPYLYFQGVIAHELIHAYLDQTRQEACERHPHSWRFRQEMERVAKALDVPEWTMPDGRRSGDKLDATRIMAGLERYLAVQENRLHGLTNVRFDTPGWPTELYDAEDWRDEPPSTKK